MTGLAIDIRNVQKSFSGHVAVRTLSLQVPRGSVYGLLGPNGAGKTTTIRMMLNIIAPDAGNIEIFGVANTSRGLLDRVGYLPEERGLYKKMQVRRLLKFLAELKGVTGRVADGRIDMWLDRLALLLVGLLGLWLGNRRQRAGNQSSERWKQFVRRLAKEEY